MEKSKCLANILSFGKFKTIEYIHYTSWYFKNDSQLKMYSRHRNSVMPVNLNILNIIFSSWGKF